MTSLRRFWSPLPEQSSTGNIDPKRAKFRTWLGRVAHNAILNALTRGRPDRGSGDPHSSRCSINKSRRIGPDSELLRLKHRREVFRWAVHRFARNSSRPRGMRSG